MLDLGIRACRTLKGACNPMVRPIRLSLSLSLFSGRVRTGMASTGPRDYMVFTVNSMQNLQPGSTYVARQFILTGRHTGMHARADAWVDEVSPSA